MFLAKYEKNMGLCLYKLQTTLAGQNMLFTVISTFLLYSEKEENEANTGKKIILLDAGSQPNEGLALCEIAKKSIVFKLKIQNLS